ncbi:3856_t:CDS:1, partial [Gigaspora rosea]
WKLHKLMCARIRQQILEILRILKKYNSRTAISSEMQIPLLQCHGDGLKGDADCHALSISPFCITYQCYEISKSRKSHGKKMSR